MRRSLLSTVLVFTATVPALRAEDGDPSNPRALTRMEFLSLPADSPIIIDNDSFFDVPGHYYLAGLASVGRADLRGIVVTPAADAEMDQPRLDRQMRDVRERIEIAREAGLRGVPDAVPGSFETDFRRPDSSVIEETKVVRESAGSALIVREARAAARAGKKLIVAIGGEAATVAIAYLTDPSIADHVVVIAIGFNGGANGLHEWASWIISKRMKLAHYSTHNPFPNEDPDARTPGEWWPQRPEELMPQGEIDAVPNEVMRAELQRLKDRWASLYATEPSFVIEGYGDSEGYWVLYAKDVYAACATSRVRWVRPGHYVLYDEEPDPNRADVLQLSLDHDAAIDDFFDVLQDPSIYHED